MKCKIFGRKSGSDSEFKLLITSNGASTCGRRVDPEKLRKFELENTKRSIKMFQEKQIEGYVLFEGDAQHFKFAPNTDFQLARR